jgi:hypothetical protein
MTDLSEEAWGNLNWLQKKFPLHPPTLVLHSHIVHKKEVLSLIETASSELLNEQDERTGMSPLHIAASIADIHITKALLNRGANLNSQDAVGNTPLHYAAIHVDKKILELLLDLADPSTQAIKNHNGATFEDIQRFLRPKLNSAEIVFYYKNDQNLIGGDAEQFKTMVNAVFCQEMVVHPIALRVGFEVNYPNYRSKAYEEFVDAYRKKYFEYLKNPPQLYIATMPKALGTGYNLWTNQIIKKGDIIIEYLGEQKTRSEMKGCSYEYAIDGSGSALIIDAAYIRNCAAMINDGFPNCIGVDLKNTAGLSERLVLVASEDIEKGEALFWDYGASYPIKGGDYYTFRTNELENYFSQHTLNQLYQELLGLSHYKTVDELCDLLFKSSKLEYLLNTPSVLQHLMAKKMIDRKELLDLLQTEKFQQLFRGDERARRSPLIEKLLYKAQ